MDERWHTSSYSSNHGGNCVEVAEWSDSVGVRDTRDRDGGHLSFPLAEWSVFLAEVRRGEL
ncbi:DUF397 domain-containing protein [Halostreptopolyspora alba]|uniref:DUF397 domain-containing protein n=1 Tax=Halostreptopolyspora alba TaxID=2487137 RepID=A0A3N0E7Q0_9ACTN|nr:DUF397 domain-containing protein [Nocardiopsaceae bacterium YIM 96095]